jgi:hypothetical protein
LQKSKIEQPKNSRQSRSRGFSPAASLGSATTGTRDRFWTKRYGSLTSPRVIRICGSKNFRSSPEKDFCNNICQEATWDHLDKRPPNEATRMKYAGRPKLRTDDEKQRLARLARRGADAYEISAALGRHVGSVRKMAREMKFVLRRRKVRVETAN